MNLRDRQSDLIDSYAIIEDPVERFQVIVDSSAGKLRDFPEEFRKEEFLVEGCQSSVWLVGRIDSKTGLFQLDMDSDAPALKGVVALFVELYSGALPNEVVAVEPEFLSELQIDRILTTTRRRGLGFVREKIKSIASSGR